jgi:hypothetical protein
MGPLAPPARDGSPGLPLSLPPGWPLAPAGWREDKDRGRRNPRKSRSRAGFDTGPPSRRLPRAYAVDLGRPPDRGQAYSRRPRVKSAAPQARSVQAAVAIRL